MKQFGALNTYNKVFLLVSLIVLFKFNIFFYVGQEYSLLALSFLNGKLYLPDWYKAIDTILYNGRLFWPLGPFPAVLLMPFVLIFNFFNLFFYQGYLNLILTVGILLICYKIAKTYKFSNNDSLTLSLGFCFASVYQSVALMPTSQYFSHVVTVLLTIFTLYRFLEKKINYYEIGIMYSLIFMTRFTAGLGVLFFLADILFKNGTTAKNKIASMVKIAIPIGLAGALLMIYNYLRFDNLLDNGYRISSAHLLTEEQRYEVINYGIFKLKNVPTNFYYYFVKTVDPVVLNVKSFFGNTYILKAPFIKVGFPGVGFFVVSPIFLYMFRIEKFNRIVKLALLPTVVVTLMLLTYYWPGWMQVGPRYMLDVLPFLYLLLLESFMIKKLSTGSKLLILFSSVFNLYLMWSMTAFYPKTF